MQIRQVVQIRNLCAPVVFMGVLILNGVVLIVSARAQAPVVPTIVVGTNGLGGEVGIWSMDPAGQNELLLLEIGGEPVPTGLVWSPNGEMLAFHTELTNNIDIYTVRADGKNLRRLTEHEAADIWPTWHPSGQKLAFATNRDGNFEIYTMTAQGNVGANLTADAAPDTEPSWSPDGRKIAFSTKRGRTIADIYVMDSNGENLQNLSNHKGQDIQPRWSPDGQTLAWVSRRDGTGDVNLIDPDGENQRWVKSTEEKKDATWSPDGKSIASLSFPQGIFIYNEIDNLVAGETFEAELKAADNFVQIMVLDKGKRARSPAWFDPAFAAPPFGVSPDEKRPLTWGWLKQLGPSN